MLRVTEISAYMYLIITRIIITKRYNTYRRVEETEVYNQVVNNTD